MKVCDCKIMDNKIDVVQNNINSKLMIEKKNLKDDSILEAYTYNNKQIKSRERVNNHGEVLTPEWVVKEMLDLIPISATQIQSRYLESSVGEGAFLVEVLRRKLDLAFEKYEKKSDREFYTLVAVSNIYGFELLKDNVDIARLRLETLVKEYFKQYSDKKLNKNVLEAVRLIINNNIINMDSLKFKAPIFDENGKVLRNLKGEIIYKDEPIRISEWIFHYKKKEIKRVEYFYEDIVYEQKQKYLLSNKQNDIKLEDNKYKLEMNINLQSNEELENKYQISFFENLICDNENNIKVEENKKEMVRAKPIKIFTSVHYLKLGKM